MDQIQHTLTLGSLFDGIAGFPLAAADRHAVAVPEAFRLSSFGGFAKGVGTLRASGGDNGGAVKQ